MISHQQWMALCLAGCCWVSLENGAGGQDTTGGTSGSSSSSGSGGASSGSSGTGGSTGSSPIFGTPASSGSSGSSTSGSGASSSFGSSSTTSSGDSSPGAGSSGEGTTPSGTTGGTTGGATGGTGTGAPGGEQPTGNTRPTEAPPSYTLPGFYGSGGTTLVGGSGRLAKPRYTYSFTTSVGYDDNIFQTPSNPGPDQVILVDPGAPASTTYVPVTTTVYVPAFAGPIIYYRPVATTTYKAVVTPAKRPRFETIKQPEPTGSLISRGRLSFETQAFTRRSLFTFDINGQADYYWDRPAPSKKEEFSGSASLSYLYRLTPRLQFSATANVAYLTQPDIQRINTPERLGAGNLINGLARVNLDYRWTPRLSTTVSVSGNSVNYEEAASQTGDSLVTTFGTELRYLWKARYTLVGEYRHAITTYQNFSTRDSSTDFFLVGGDFALSTKLAGTVRVGQSIRTFDSNGEQSSSPYGEVGLNYRLSPLSLVRLSGRYGFEEPPDIDTEVLTLRSTLSFVRSITPRLTVNSSLSGVMRKSSQVRTESLSETTLEGALSVQYRWTRDLSLNADLSHTRFSADNPNSDYNRTRIFLGLEYVF